MKPSYDFEESLFKNEHLFQDNFFKRFQLRGAPQPLRLDRPTGQVVLKDYQFPTFYGDASCQIAIFHCDYEKAKKIMPHKKLHPVRMTKGRSLVIFSCYEYRNVMNVPPYNEVAMTIPVMFGDTASVPVLPMVLSSLFSNFGFYVFSMPVTSKENEIRGQKIWGLPKITQEIEIVHGEKESSTKIFDEQGRCYFDLKVPHFKRKKQFDVVGHLYSLKGKQLLKAQTCFQGKFDFKPYFDLLWVKNKPAERQYLNLDASSPWARQLIDLDIEAHPFQFRFARHMNACFDLPNDANLDEVILQ